MKKMIYLMLFLIVLGAASVNAQVRIGGTENPATGAVLDLNKDDGTNDKGLLLPKVALQSSTDNTTVGPHTSGMVVYNIATAGDVTPGFYYNNASAWVRMDDGTSIATDAIDSTNIKNGTVGLEDIRDEIITSTKIMDGSIMGSDFASMGASTGQALVWDGSTWVPTFTPTVLTGRVPISWSAGSYYATGTAPWLSGCMTPPTGMDVWLNHPGAGSVYCGGRDLLSLTCSRMWPEREWSYDVNAYCLGR